MKQPDLKKIFFGALGALIILALLMTGMLYFERQNPDADIKGFADVFWYSMVTLTTVGYGDLVPSTTGGKALGYFFLIISLSMYAFVIGQISNIMTTIKENRKLGLNGTKFKNHVVIIGWSDFGKAVTDQLVGAGRQVAIVTKEKNNVDLIRELYKTRSIFVLYSDYNNLDSLEKVNIGKSSIVFVNLNDDTEKLVYILNLKKNYQKLDYIVTLNNANLKSTFQSAGVTYAISNSEIASKLLASYIFEPDVAIYTEEILAYAKTDEMYDMKEYMVVEGNPYVNESYGKAFYDLKKECNVILVGLVKDKKGDRKLMKNPPDDTVIEAGDYMIMITNRTAVKKLTSLFMISEGHL